MPKVITTAAKGLVQSSGAGFKQLDFLIGYTGNLTGTVNAILVAEGEAAELAETPTGGEIALATINANALNTTTIDGTSGTTAVYLPAAVAGTHCALVMPDPAGANACVVIASHATYNSAGEAARIAAGGTAAVFGAIPVAGSGSGAGLSHDISSGSEKNLTIAFNSTNCAHKVGGVYHFFCVEDGVWAVALHSNAKGTALSATALAFA